MQRTELKIKNYHILNTRTWTVRNLFDFLKESGYKIELVPFTEWYEGLLKQGEKNALYFFKDLFTSRDQTGSLFWERYSHRQARVQCTHTESILNGAGITCPEITSTLLGKYFHSFREQGYI
jgi:hypothetical protein